MRQVLKFSILTLIIFGCGVPGSDRSPEDKTEDSLGYELRTDSVEKIISTQNPPDRFVWQKPSLILDLLGDLEGKVVADIGAGYGFFTLLIPYRKGDVIAIDIDSSALDWIRGASGLLPPEIRNRISTRLSVPEDPMLREGEVDIILIVNTIGYIENKVDYLKLLRRSLSQGGRILVVDYKTKRIPIEIPKELKMPLSEVEDLLYAAGFSEVKSDDCLLEYQYVVTAATPDPSF